MYGFHKVPHLQQGVLMGEMKEETWEFAHIHFQKGQPDLLSMVQRKRSKDGEKDPLESGNVDINNIIHEISSIKRHQMTISADLKNIQRQNNTVWAENAALREQYQTQQNTIENILRFLASLFQGKLKNSNPQQQQPLLINSQLNTTDPGNFIILIIKLASLSSLRLQIFLRH